MSLRNLLNRDNINEINTTFFSTVIITYIIILLIDIVTSGFVARLFNINIFLFLCAVSAFIMMVFPPKKSYFADKFSKNFLLIVSLLAGALVYAKTFDTGWEGIIFSLAVLFITYQSLKLFYQP
ncbi:MAG: hypothetical protein ABIE68_03900 [bacterium]